MIVADAKTLITQSIAQSLERMAFLDVLPCLEMPGVPAAFVLAEIQFTGSISGAIQVAADLQLARQLASAMGLLDEPTEDHCLDAIRELVNVSCGLILPFLAIPDADPFDVHIPRAVLCDESAEWNRRASEKDSVALDVAGYPVIARITLSS